MNKGWKTASLTLLWVQGFFCFTAGEMAQELIFIRHGDIGLQYHGRFIGITDVSLSAKGYRQAENLNKFVRKMRNITCFSSPMKRAQETAQIAVATAGLKFVLDPDLCETNFGQWEGLTFEEIQARDPEGVNRWAHYESDFSFPVGERIGDFLHRVHRVGNGMAADEAHTVLAFTHGGVIRTLVCYFLGLAPHHYLLFDIRPASLTTIKLFNGKGILTGLSDVCHIEKE
jgi:broad specificity phosphatase PhoE